MNKKFASSSRKPMGKGNFSRTRSGGASDGPAAWIWGLHSIEACLECHPELILEIQAETKADLKALDRALTGAGLKLNRVEQLPKQFAEKRTQGIVAKLKSFPEIDFKDYRDDLIARLETPLAPGEAPAQWAVLDGIEDPRNYGAILRSAAAFGIEAIFVRERNQAPLNGVVAQASAGNLFRVPVVTCVNFNAIVDLFIDSAHVVLGLEAEAQDMESTLKKHTQHRLWVLGGEGRGIRDGLREKCNALVSIPMAAGVESLNASAAATIAFYLARNV